MLKFLLHAGPYIYPKCESPWYYTDAFKIFLLILVMAILALAILKRIKWWIFPIVLIIVVATAIFLETKKSKHPNLCPRDSFQRVGDHTILPLNPQR